MFSPYYAFARRKKPANAENHCAINVALYRPGGKSWAMTERGAHAMRRDATTLVIGPSALSWIDGVLEIRIDEKTVPWPSAIKGVVRVTPTALFETHYPLDREGRHLWRPIAPIAHVEASFSSPSIRWSGPGYLDSNFGAEPLEARFASWTWSRSEEPGCSTIYYDVQGLNSDAGSLALRFRADGTVIPVQPPPVATLPPTGWRIARSTRADPDRQAHVRRTLEDTPFYARSIIEATIDGKPVKSMHESLSLRRFASPIVQAMLPFRMPRRSG